MLDHLPHDPSRALDPVIADVTQHTPAVVGVDAAPSAVVVVNGHHAPVDAGDPVARACDAAQDAHGAGPRLLAVATGSPVLVPDVAAEHRWPQWRDACLAHGVRAAAVVTAPHQGVLVALTLHRTAPTTWHDDVLARAATTAADLARLAWVQRETGRLLSDVAASTATRPVIDQAIGVIMAQNRCDADEAMVILRRASSHRNVKLHAIAASIVESVAGRVAEPRGFRPRRDGVPDGTDGTWAGDDDQEEQAVGE